MNTLFTTPRARVLTIGVGSMGCAAARMGAENGDESGSVCWSALHDNAAELIATGLEQKVFLKIPEGPFAAQHIAHSIAQNSERLAELADGRDAVVLCGCMSEPHAGTILACVYAALTEMKSRVFVLALEPHSLLSLQVLEELEERTLLLAQSVSFLALLNPGTEKVSAGISTRRLQRMAAERLMGAAECFASALDPVNETSPFLRNMRGAHRAVFAAANGGAAALTAFELAIASYDENARERLSAVILQSAEELPFRDARAILRKMSEDARHRAAVCTAACPAFAGQTACLLFSAEPRAANVVGIEEAAMSAQ